MKIANSSPRQLRPVLLTVIMLIAALAMSGAAWANTASYNFVIMNSDGINSSGTLTLSNTGPWAHGP